MIVVDMNQRNEWGFCCVRVKGVRSLNNLLAFVDIHNPRPDRTSLLNANLRTQSVFLFLRQLVRADNQRF